MHKRCMIENVGMGQGNLPGSFSIYYRNGRDRAHFEPSCAHHFKKEEEKNKDNIT